MADRLRAAAPANPAARLAAIMAAGGPGRAGQAHRRRPRRRIATFGLWLEQLLAESTGKDGTGIVPVVGEPLGRPEVYGDDRLFVALGEGTQTAALDALAGRRPPGRRCCPRATSSRPWAARSCCGSWPPPWPGRCSASTRSTSPTWPRPRRPPRGCSAATPRPSRPRRSSTCSTRCARATTWPSRPSSTPAVRWWRTSTRARVALRDRLRVATTVGLGPRFLHSTGQLHKGGPDTGVFVQVVGDDPDDVPIPGAGYGFSTLKHAQADGDLLVLGDRKRRAGRVRLDELVEVAT